MGRKKSGKKELPKVEQYFYSVGCSKEDRLSQRVLLNFHHWRRTATRSKMLCAK